MYIDRDVDEIVQQNSIDFAQYVIKHRALPNLFSGMKPIHEKILWTMFENKTFDFLKSATTSGRVMEYSPHGDCYPTMVYLVQKDRHKYNLLEGQGNWGSSCSKKMKYGASRYTECRMSKLGIDCMQGISKNMVKMIGNYDNSSKMPKHLPTRFPIILCMASNGIAVGMANNSPSFNLEEVCNANIAYLKGEKIPMLIPDFATGGYIVKDMKEIERVNFEGLGDITLRAKYKIEGNSITITEIPYGVKINIEAIIDRIIDKVKKGDLKEVTNVLNQTGIQGLSIGIDCKKGTDMKKLMNKLFAMTPLESNFSSNMNMLLDGRPVVLGVHSVIKEWTIFRRECMVNGLNFDITKLEKELHFLHGLKKVLVDIDKAVAIIRHSDNIINELIDAFSIDSIQADSITNIKLGNINEKYVIKQIAEIDGVEIKLNDLKLVVDSPAEIDKLIIEDLQDVIKKFKQPRRTKIIEADSIVEITKEDLIPDYSCKITYTKHGYIKKTLKTIETSYMKDDDSQVSELNSSNKSVLLLFTNKANRYKIPCASLDTCNNPSKALGEFIPNLIELEKGEEIIRIISVDESSQGYIMSVFENGKVAKINIKSFMANYVKLKNSYAEESKLLDIKYIDVDVDILFVTEEGKALIVSSSRISSKGSRNAKGNMAVSLGELEGNKVIGTIINPHPKANIILETEKGKSKEFRLDDNAPTNKVNEQRNLYEYIHGRPNNSGSFLINTRTNNDKVIKFILNESQL
ncbi:DNA gyrase subunit A [Clostridium tagluense]|uniref:DNA gyrase subunit A n=1 Tax=Clostridium tagluense TaxID=360422 RepID=A0A401UQG2_9CLOT|nr:DNA topoisomerase (ATP-hydrolyzing) subunit A [Clostridium tagluense]GCD11767.1 DNA gyrase subunit A [Clostridium tagluense]